MSSEEEDYDYEYSDDYEYSEDEEDVEDDFSDNEADSVEDLALEDAFEYNVLSSKDIQSRVDEEISQISSLLSLPSYAARILLCKFGWNVSKVHEEWFSDETKTRKSCGLIMVNSDDHYKKNSEQGEFFCGICFESYDKNEENHRSFAAVCGHVFCETCYRTYISLSIKDGMGALSLTCPEPSCSGVSIAYMVDAVLSDEDKARYENLVLRSYAESRKNIKWCPSPGCEYSFECLDSVGAISSDVTCKCSYRFCFNCGEENHSPADCGVVGKWMVKNSSEAENTNWLLSNTKPCPKCHKSIEKNNGCMHMSCRPPCNYHFCWLCLGEWSSHNEKTGGFYACNKFKKEKEEGKYNEAEKVRTMAKAHLVKYTHYYERWVGNHNSRAKAVKSLEELSSKHMKTLSDMYMMTEYEMKFAIDAMNQIVEGRRVLKWTYAIGYYLPEKNEAKKNFFEFMQGEAESKLEKLHDLVENGLTKHIEEAESKLGSDERDSSSERFELDKVFKHTREATHLGEFNRFRADVVDLTKVTRFYFETMVTKLASGLTDVQETVTDAPPPRPKKMVKEAPPRKNKKR